MNGGLSQDARILAHVVEQPFQPFTGFDPMDGADDRVAPSRDNPCYRHPGCDCFVECAALTDAEHLQHDYDPPIGDPIGLIRSIGMTRILGAAAFAAIAWTATAAFAVMCGVPQ